MITELDETFNCPTHGEYRARNISSGAVAIVIRTCPKCADESVATEEKKQKDAELKSRIEAFERRLKSACIPERFIGKTINNYVVECEKQQHAVDVSKGYAENFHKHLKNGEGLIFIGNTGNGKNHLAIGIAQAVMQNGYVAQYITFPDFVSKMTAWQSKGDSLSQDAIMAMMREPDLLILDEVGVGASTEYQKDVAFRLINARYEKNKPLIVLGNVTAPELKAFVGDRAFDRLKEMTLRTVDFKWESYRGRVING